VLGWFAVLALVSGLVVGATGAGSEGTASDPSANGGAGAPGGQGQAPSSVLEEARRTVARMGLEQQVGELLVIAFRESAAPHYVSRALRDGRAAGVILFGANAPSATSVRAMTARLQRAAGGEAIVCLDQEGGDIRTLAFAPSALGQAHQRTPAAAGAAAVATARALRAVGVNVVLGPVADVAAGTPRSIMATRAYPGGSDAVAASVRAAVGAYERAGIAPTLKHFPGLGGATVNTDDAPAVVRRTGAQLTAEDLRPYRVATASPPGVGGGSPAVGPAAGAAAPTPLVMVGHARYPALDPHRIASQSHAIVTDLLRSQLGFDGVVMTDSLEAEASLAASGRDVGTAAVRSIAAGVDLLLLTGPGSFLPAHDAVVAQAHRSPAFRARIADAAARVLVLRRTLRAQRS
jgi:beta-N-acetylhexosaminidase